MVQAELTYNPYLLETEVSFNGNPPRINSQVEKYQGQKLQTWMNDIPSIFYNEMNGYDFELDFDGTALDYEELKSSFIQAGVTKDMVRLFHREVLEGRREKTTSIEKLLDWLDRTPNRRFNLREFRTRNKDLFESAYPFVVIGGNVVSERSIDGIEVSIDNVQSVDELRKTDLRSTPILFFLDRKTVGALQRNLLQLLARKDIMQEQLFFMVSPVLGEKVVRVIKDLGIKTPQVITALDDDQIVRFLELFPVSEYIYEAIKAFRRETDALGEVLETENKRSEATNKDVHKKIKALDDTLARLKSANNLFINRANYDLPQELLDAKSDLINAVYRWKIKKTKTTTPEEAVLLSSEFETEVAQLFEAFKQAVRGIYSSKCLAIQTRCETWFKSARVRVNSDLPAAEPSTISDHSAPDIANALLNIKEEQYVTPKEDLFGRLFRITDDASMEPVLETTYYLEKWRDYAAEAIEPSADEMIDEVYSSLQQYYKLLSEAYITFIEAILQKETAEKETVSSQLSEDEHLLQIDNDWFAAFCDKLQDIERS